MSVAVKRLEELYRAHGPALLAYLRGQAGPSAAAEDLLHETFLQAIRRIGRMEDVVSPRAWLFAIARNVSISAWRRRRKTMALPDEVAAAAPACEDSRREKMRLAIAELPGKLRETLELKLRDDLSYEEIAAVLGIPVGTVRSRLHNAVRQLRKMLGTREDNHEP
jgi:RNA polymerase sigma-70 factor (ECF subfamily)